MSYQIFFAAIDTQGRTLMCMPLVSHSRKPVYSMTIRKYIAELVVSLQDLDDRGVSPPLLILDHTQVLREIMVVYQSSLPEDEDAETQAAGFRDIIDKMVDPAVEMCMISSEGKAHLRPGWDRSVFILNTLAYLQVGVSCHQGCESEVLTRKTYFARTPLSRSRSLRRSKVSYRVLLKRGCFTLLKNMFVYFTGLETRARC